MSKQYTAPGATSTSQARLLILDDDPLVGKAVSMMAASLGAQSAYCRTATEFFVMLADWEPSHILLDLVMPGVDGVEVIQKLGEIRCQAKLVIVSGVDGRVLEAAQRSARHHQLSLAGALSKPFSKSALATLLESDSVSVFRRYPTPTPPTPSEAELALALDIGDIGPVFQPKVRCGDGGLVGYEALARWTRNGNSVCGPDTFVPLAESSGQAARLTEVIADASLRWLGSNFASSPLSMAINVPAQCLTGDATLRTISDACSRYNIAPQRVVLEITESGAIDPRSDALDVLTRARLMGMQLSLDDFGVGYASLVQLSRMPFSEIKIDRGFVADLCASTEAHALIAAIIGMSNGLGMNTVAEGVEDLATYLRLREMGCYAAQGYFIGRPMGAERAVAWADVA